MQPHEQDDTGVDVGSNETGSARTSADPGQPGRLRGLTARLLVAVAGLLALPLQAEAQKRPPSSPTPARAPIPTSGESAPMAISGNFKHNSSAPATMRVAIRSRQFKSG